MRELAELTWKARLWVLFAALGIFGVAPASSLAAPVTYVLSSGTLTLRAVLDGVGDSVLAGGVDGVDLALGSSYAVFDPDFGANGRLSGLMFEPAGVIDLNLEPSLVALESVSIANAIVENDTGATADLNFFGQFLIDTVMSGDVSGVYPAPGGAFGPVFVSSTSSQAGGALTLSAGQVTLNLLGVSVGQFPQLAGAGPDLVVTADVFFTGTALPEASTGLLVGFSLLSLATRRSRRMLVAPIH